MRGRNAITQPEETGSPPCSSRSRRRSSNKSSSTHYSTEFLENGEIMAALRSANALDCALYHFGFAIFVAQVEAMEVATQIDFGSANLLPQTVCNA
eukprot:m.31571 g.31571  ORF g.31571 m.31571 type:complete len:96 (+) comp12504_c1_seq1:647-934(+)